jgi:anthranilate/para-aminobenzoate synthase component I
MEVTGDRNAVLDGDPFELLRSELGTERVWRNSALGNFTGGAVGYFSYDCARYVERLPEQASDDLDLPESYFLFFDRFYEIDHVEEKLRVVYAPMLDGRPPEEQYAGIETVLDEMRRAIGREPLHDLHRAPAGASMEETGASLTPAEFEAIVARAKEYIRAGDIFQVNLSVRFRQSLAASPLALYETLRGINPSPYMSFFDLPELAIASASPELLLKVRDDLIETRPIAGTRPRGASDEEDRANAEELIANEKERAEHLMLVDLERNDIGRVAAYGSVQVNEFMGIERYSHVIHIVSNVRGLLAEGKDLFDAIRACFPGGTITGAPKVRSMEIIEELEPHRRGLYTGSIGWLGFDRNAELNIAIRTIVVVDGVAYMQAGAGIVHDSVPANEYLESARKAEAALVAVRQANARAAESGILHLD